MKKHIFIFNGSASTGKTELCKLITDSEYLGFPNTTILAKKVLITDDFYFYDENKKDYDREKIRNLLNDIESLLQFKFTDKKVSLKKAIIVCNTNREHIQYLIDYIKNYYEVMSKETPDISYVEFSKM